MSYSGNHDFVLDRTSLIDEAYSLAAIKDVTETLTADETFDAVRSLNIIMKSLSIQGARVFLFDDYVAFPLKGKRSITFPGFDYSLAKDFVKTRLSVAALIGASSVTVDSGPGMTAGGKIGLFDGSVFERFTIAGVAGNVITLSTPLAKNYPAQAIIYAYKPLSYKLLKIQEVSLRYFDDTRVNMGRVSQAEWSQYSVPNATGVPVQYFYRAGVDKTELFYYPQIEREDMYFEIIGVKPFDDMDNANDNPTIPNELYDPLIYLLAARLATKYGYNAKSDKLKAEANAMLPDIEAWDTTDTTVSITAPDW